jgi:hypothetical protein
MGMYPSSGCGSSAFGDPFHLLAGDPDAFVSSPTVEQLLASIDAFAQIQAQENVSPSSSDSTPVDPTQAFDFDEFVKDFGLSAPQEATDDAPCAEDQSIAVTLSVTQNSSAPPNVHSVSVASPMQSFYVTTPSPDSTDSTMQPYVPPRGAANAGVRRVGGSWTVPIAVSRLASPLPSCTASPNHVVA